MKKSHILKIIIFSVVLKLLYISFAYTVAYYDDDFAIDRDIEGAISIFKRNDSYWYESIHDNGYPEINKKSDLGWHDGPNYHQSSWGFMPGYPLVVKMVSSILGTTFDISAFILAVILSTLCFILFYWLSTYWFAKSDNAFFSTLLFMSMPFQYYYSMMYSEALFSALLLGSLILLTKKHYLLAALLISVMTIVRASGLILVLPIGIFILEIIKQKEIEKIFSISFLKKNAFYLIYLVIPLFTFLGYCLYQYFQTGYYNAYSIAQQNGWYREIMFPLAGLFRSSDFVSQFNSWYAIFIMVMSFIAWKKLSLSYNLIIWISILLPLAAGSSVAMTRYVASIFPLFIIIGYWLRNYKLRITIIPILVISQLCMFYFWIMSYSFSQ